MRCTNAERNDPASATVPKVRVVPQAAKAFSDLIEKVERTHGVRSVSSTTRIGRSKSDIHVDRENRVLSSKNAGGGGGGNGGY